MLSHLHSLSDIKTLLLCLFALDAQERENCLTTPPRPGTRCELDTQICTKGRRKSFSCMTIPSSHSHIHLDTHIHTLKHLLIPHPNRELCNAISKKTTQVVVVADKNQIHNSGFWPSPGMILKRIRIILVKDHFPTPQFSIKSARHCSHKQSV